MTTTTSTYVRLDPANEAPPSLSEAIARLRALGCKVSTTIGHDPEIGDWLYSVRVPDTAGDMRRGVPVGDPRTTATDIGTARVRVPAYSDGHHVLMSATTYVPGRKSNHSERAARRINLALAMWQLAEGLEGSLRKPDLAALVHAATDDGDGHCTMCGQPVHRVPGGQGMTYVHPDGSVAARTPAALIAARTLTDDWRQRATELSPDRPETYENDPDDETDDAIADTMVDCARALDAILRPHTVEGSTTDV